MTAPPSNPCWVGIYGGSFDPPHLAHQLTLLAVLETRPVDEIWLVPTFRHAFDKRLTDFGTRLLWCRALIVPFGERVRICEVERELGTESRTIDTLDELTRRHPDRSFSLILGTDIRAERSRWKAFDELERRFPIHWIGRVGHSTEPGDELILPDISSTEVRRRLAAGLPLERLIPARVIEAIRQSGHPWQAPSGS